MGSLIRGINNNFNTICSQWKAFHYNRISKFDYLLREKNFDGKKQTWDAKMRKERQIFLLFALEEFFLKMTQTTRRFSYILPQKWTVIVTILNNTILYLIHHEYVNLNNLCNNKKLDTIPFLQGRILRWLTSHSTNVKRTLLPFTLHRRMFVFTDQHISHNFEDRYFCRNIHRC